MVLLVVVLTVLLYPSFVLGVVTIKITDTGDKIGESLKARVKDLAIHRVGEGEGTGWITILNQSDTYDFISLGDRTQTVLRSKVNTGQYDRIRFSLIEATLVVNGSSTRLLAPTDKIIVAVSFSISSETVVLIDFRTNYRQTMAQKTYFSSPIASIQN